MPSNPPPFSWPRLLFGISIGSVGGLFLAWVVAPLIAVSLIGGPDSDAASVGTGFLLLDLLLSFLAFFAGSVISYRIARTHPYLACLAVSLIGWFVYFNATDGLLAGEFPLWYDLAPIHFGSGLLAAWFVCRHD